MPVLAYPLEALLNRGEAKVNWGAFTSVCLLNALMKCTHQGKQNQLALISTPCVLNIIQSVTCQDIITISERCSVSDL